ncbi:MAG TPA: M48 family metallopeptidase [Kineosporiaceae bacterium]|nr:M48 family metallopeptidase [Kineosporiaceae bacterium]
MLTRLRAVLAVTMLAGFYVLATGILAALAGFTWWAWNEHPGTVAAKLSVVTVVAAWTVGLGLFRAVRARPELPDGIPLTADQAPELWQSVQELAGIAGTEPPAEIVLVEDVNAAVSEDSRLLGLIGGRRRLFLGIPLLVGLDVTQLRSVLAHELGHYSGRHTRLGAVNYRGRVAIVGTLSELTGLAAWLLRQYAKLYFVVEAAVSRRQELEADQASASAVGAQAAAGALSEIPVLAAAWNFYLEAYVASAWEDGIAPEDLFGGFTALLAGRTDELTRLRGEQLPEEHSPWDSHPPIAVRVAALSGMAGPDQARDTRPAHTLVPQFERHCGELTRRLAAAQDKTLTAWPALTAAAVAGVQQRQADIVYRAVARVGRTATGDLAGLIGLIRDGRSGELARDLFPQPAEGPAEVLAEPVELLLCVAAVQAGLAHWQHSWSGPAELVRADGTALDFAEVAALLVRPESLDAGLARLAAAGIDLQQGRQAQSGVSVRGAEVIGGLSGAKVDGEARDVLILTNGLVLVPCPKGGDPRRRLTGLAETEPAELVARYGLLPFEEVTQARLLKRTPVGVELHLHDGRTVTVQETWSGARLTKDSDALLAQLAAPEPEATTA